jgi:hypothetical protein
MTLTTRRFKRTLHPDEKKFRMSPEISDCWLHYSHNNGGRFVAPPKNLVQAIVCEDCTTSTFENIADIHHKVVFGDFKKKLS